MENIAEYLEAFRFGEGMAEGSENAGVSLNKINLSDSFDKVENPGTLVEKIKCQNGHEVLRFENEFWTSRQRQANSLHEVSYRACFKPQLPRFFISLLSKAGDWVLDPFGGRGTTALEAALMGRQLISNDVNPLSEILCAPRLIVPDMIALGKRLHEIPFEDGLKADIDLSMFYHPQTLSEILSLKDYLNRRKVQGVEDALDQWIRMVATNRLTGHSSGFFSVYTLPPNQAVSAESQIRINAKRNQQPPYRDVRKIILQKTRTLISKVTEGEKKVLLKAAPMALFLNGDARRLTGIADAQVQLTVTSPPFLDVVQYAADNWLRCWFNGIDANEVEKKITMSGKLEDWCGVMQDVFVELNRVTRKGGYVAFEVGEVRNGKIKLDEHVVNLGCEAGFSCIGIVINKQEFTKTSNIWGVSNNARGTNSNRIVLFKKD